MKNRALLVKAREELRKVLTTYSRSPLTVPFGSLLSSLAPLLSCDHPFARGLYNLALEGKELPIEMARLVQDFRNRATPGSSFRPILWKVNSRHDNRRLYFTSGRGSLLPQRITHRMLSPMNPDGSWIAEVRDRMIELNRSMSLHRRRVLRVQHLLRRADAEWLPRRRALGSMRIQRFPGSDEWEV